MEKDHVVLLGCGDVGPMEEPISRFSELIRPVLATGDIRFAQCERLYSERGVLRPHGYPHCRINPRMSSVFTDCGFDVVSLASNHAGDWGEEALIDTMAVFRQMNIPTAGAGHDAREARKPVIIERNGLRIAFLAYCSVLRDGYEARNDKAGIAPLRAYTYYESRDSNPGVPPRVVSAPYQEDLDAMLEDVTAARKLADSVVLSMHWGIHYYEKIVAEYQPIIAHAAIDAGADLILGHHPHLLKAIEVYKGKVCFYSLGEFIMQLERTPQNAAALVRKYGIKLDPNYPKLAHGEGCHRVLIAKAVFTKQGIQKVSCLPVMINPDLRPEALRRGDPRFDDMVRYAEWISEGYDHKFTVDGDEICITA